MDFMNCQSPHFKRWKISTKRFRKAAVEELCENLQFLVRIKNRDIKKQPRYHVAQLERRIGKQIVAVAAIIRADPRVLPSIEMHDGEALYVSAAIRARLASKTLIEELTHPACQNIHVAHAICDHTPVRHRERTLRTLAQSTHTTSLVTWCTNSWHMQSQTPNTSVCCSPHPKKLT